MEYKIIEIEEIEGDSFNNIDYKNTNIKYTFNGDSPYLIDKFLIFGYEKKYIEFTYLYNKDSKKENIVLDVLKSYNLDERPSVINEIDNNFTKVLLDNDNDLISKLIFPKIPKLFYLDIGNTFMKHEINNYLLTHSYSIVFSINPEDKLGQKKSYNGLGYTFFAPQEHKENGLVVGYFYIPMAYFILSEYPYFYHFNKICKSLFNQIKKENEIIPIEIILYNIIKYLQSPINKTEILLFERVGFSFEPININEIDINLLSENGKSPPILFSQLVGYPIFDFNLSFIFNLLPEDIIIQTFIFTFLEYDIIFYSNHSKILNLIMYIFSNLNYPFNDSEYYSYILSSSIEDFISERIPFKDKIKHCMIGINNSYDPEINTTDKIKEHFILDIDNKKLIFNYKEKTNDVKNTYDLYLFIKECLEQKLYWSNLYKNLHILMDELSRRATKASRNYKDSVIKPDFFILYENESEMECLNYNFLLQKVFLTFVIEIYKYFLNYNNNINDDNEKNNEIQDKEIISKEDNNNNDIININEEDLIKQQNIKNLEILAEKIFKEKFLKTSKYNNFINYCDNQNTSDFYKIPYAFIYEFLGYSFVNSRDIDLFKLIDQFYGKREKIDLEELKCHHGQKDNKTHKEKDIFLFSFNDFKNHYKKNLSTDINREQEDDTEIFMKVKSSKKDFKKYMRKEYFLSNKLIKYYNNYLNNNYNNLGKLFMLTKCEMPKKNTKTAVNSDSDDSFDEFEVVNKKDKSKKNNKNNIIINKKDPNNNINNNLPNKKSNIFDYYLLNNKNIDKSEKETKIFGTYELIEIADIIEKQLISDRYFSSYTMIKFSLLNILAITRKISINLIENQKIIKTLFDFCEQTNFLVRKYIIIYLDIFQTMRKKKGKTNKKEVNELDECINRILFYLNKSNMILKEESINEKEKESKESKKSKESYFSGETRELEQNPKESNKYSKGDTIYNNQWTPQGNDDQRTPMGNDDQRTPMGNDDQQTPQGNDDQWTPMGNDNDEEFKKLIKDKGLFFNTKSINKELETVLRIIETIFTGCYSKVLGYSIFNDKEMIKLYKEIKYKDKEKNFIPKTPLDLYISSNKLLNYYLKHFSNDAKSNYELLIDILSLLFYFKLPIGKRWIEGKKVQKDSKNFEEELNQNLKIIIVILTESFNIINKEGNFKKI